jgi:hypothetical protein
MAVTTRLSSPEAQTAPRIQHGGSAFKLSPSPGREKEKHSGYRQMEARWRLHLAIAAIGARLDGAHTSLNSLAKKIYPYVLFFLI